MSNLIILPLDEQISNELVKENITETVLKQIETFTALKLSHPEDKETYLEIKEKRKNARDVRLLAVKVCKKGREDAIAIQKKWVAKEKEIVDRIDKVEDYLKSQEDIYEAEKERQKQEKLRMEQENLSKRQQQLFKMGAELRDGKFILEDVEVDIVLIRESSDESYQNNILSEFIPIYERREEERKKREAEEEAERRRQAAERKRLEEEAAELKRQQDELKRQQEKLEKEKREAEEERERLAEQERQRIFNERSIFLKNLGMTFDFSNNSYSYVGEETEIHIGLHEIKTSNPEEWEELTRHIPLTISKDKDLKEQKRLAFIEEQKKKAAEEAVEQERAARRKQEEDEAEQKRLAAIAEQERIDNASDAEKWQIFVSALKAIPIPQMKAKKHRDKVAMASEKIEEILSW